MLEYYDSSDLLTQNERKGVSTAVLNWYFDRFASSDSYSCPIEIHRGMGEFASLEQVLYRDLKENFSDRKRGYLNRNFEKLEEYALELAETVLRTNFYSSHILKILTSEAESLQSRLDLHIIAELSEKDSSYFLETLKKLPYPADRSEGDLLSYLAEEEVIGTDSRGFLADVVREFYYREGYSPIPEGESFKLLAPLMQQSYEESVCNDTDLPQALSTMKELFRRERDFENYIEGKDFSFGIAGVKDNVFRQTLEDLSSFINELVENYVIESGRYLEIRDFPSLCMSKIPVIDGKWIDAEAAAMIEFYEELEREGYRIEPSRDPHPFAVPRIIKPDLSNLECPLALASRREEIVDSVSQLHWDTRIIKGRKHLPFDRFAEFIAKRSGQAMAIRKGFKARSLNRWMITSGSEDIPHGVGTFITGLEKESPQCNRMSVEDAFEERIKREELAKKVRSWSLHSGKVKSYNPSGMGDGLYDRPFRGQSDPSRKYLAELRKDLLSLYKRTNATQNCLRKITTELFFGQEILWTETKEKAEMITERTEDLISDFNTIGGTEVRNTVTAMLIDLQDRRDSLSWGSLFPDGFEIYPQNYEDIVVSETETLIGLFCGGIKEGDFDDELSGNIQRNQHGHNV